ncbi:MAG TPA: ornithine cyclodeaminase family protein [Gemmatimonadaceae bacterium]
MAETAKMLVLDGQQVRQLLDMLDCIDAVERAFRNRAMGSVARSAVAGVELPTGKLHAKLATLDLARRYAVAKVNANLPGNPGERGLPSIQGVALLFDAATGTPLAAMDSGPLTSIRTAATSAVAARWLALPNAFCLAMIGCGIQARAHVSAMLHVRPIRQIRAFDANRTTAEEFCREMKTIHNLECQAFEDSPTAARSSQIVVTSTPSQRPILDDGDVEAGTFIAAVGADSEHKQEISVSLLRSAEVIVDDIDQCTKIGDLHHAITAGVVTPADVRASLDQVVSQQVRGRLDNREIIIFDSTGVAIEDAAAAAVVYERAIDVRVGIDISFGRYPLPAPRLPPA